MGVVGIWCVQKHYSLLFHTLEPNRYVFYSWRTFFLWPYVVLCVAFLHKMTLVVWKWPITAHLTLSSNAYMELIHKVYMHCIRWIIVSTTTTDSIDTRGRTRWLYRLINSITSACEYLYLCEYPSFCPSVCLSYWQKMWLNVLPRNTNITK